MTVQCSHCGKTSSNKYTLKRHQQTKVCLRAQNKEDEYQGCPCSDCGMTISRKDNLVSHQKICVPYNIRITREEYFEFEEELETLRAEKKELQAENKELRDTLATRPTVTINN